MSADDGGLSVGRFNIPESELGWSFTASGGPGGQHANRSNTKSTLRFDLANTTVFPDELKQRMLAALGGRLVEGVLVAVADDSRSQWRNRSIARKRMAEWLQASMRSERVRRETRPTRASKEKRLDAKKSRSETKRLRRPPIE